MNMKLSSNNEWGNLKTVVVGTMAGFQPSFEFNSAVENNAVEAAQKIVWDAYPSSYIDEVSEDLEGLCDILRANGTRVLSATMAVCPKRISYACLDWWWF